MSAVVIALGPHRILGPFGSMLVVRETVDQADAIVVLLGQVRRDRTDKAGELFEQGYAPRIIFVGAYRDRPLFGLRDVEEYPLRREGDSYEAALLDYGVQKGALVKLESDGAYDTATELSVVVRYMRKHSLSKAIIVTSATHSRRVSLVWRRLAPDIPARVVGSGTTTFENWWKTRGGIRRLAYEFGALGKEALRWLLSGRLFST